MRLLIYGKPAAGRPKPTPTPTFVSSWVNAGMQSPVAAAAGHLHYVKLTHSNLTLQSGGERERQREREGQRERERERERQRQRERERKRQRERERGTVGASCSGGRHCEDDGARRHKGTLWLIRRTSCSAFRASFLINLAASEAWLRSCTRAALARGQGTCLPWSLSF